MNPTTFGTTKGVDAKFIESARRRMERDTRQIDGGCIEWVGVKPKDDGYVQVRVTRSRRPYAHRLSYELNVGEIPAGMHVLHRCDNRRCVNPAHLFLGTHQDNMRDRNEKGRQGCRSPQKRRLTVQDVREIKALRGQGLRPKDVGGRFGVSGGAVLAIWDGKTWKWA